MRTKLEDENNILRNYTIEITDSQISKKWKYTLVGRSILKYKFNKTLKEIKKNKAPEVDNIPKKLI